MAALFRRCFMLATALLIADLYEKTQFYYQEVEELQKYGCFTFFKMLYDVMVECVSGKPATNVEGGLVNFIKNEYTTGMMDFWNTYINCEKDRSAWFTLRTTQSRLCLSANFYGLASYLKMHPLAKHLLLLIIPGFFLISSIFYVINDGYKTEEEKRSILNFFGGLQQEKEENGIHSNSKLRSFFPDSKSV